MIDLTRHFSCANSDERWHDILCWLISNIGAIKFDKLRHTQGNGWLIICKMHENHTHYEYKLYFDEPNDEVMFKLACL